MSQDETKARDDPESERLTKNKSTSFIAGQGNKETIVLTLSPFAYEDSTGGGGGGIQVGERGGWCGEAMQRTNGA